MSLTRQPAVAGMFYPEDPRELQAMLLDLLATADKNLPIPKAIIAPHAGYIYSGPIAANAFACLTQATTQIQRVILLGPAHRHPFHGIAAPEADSFATPLGQIKVDQQAIIDAAKTTDINYLEIAHAQEHCLEVQLPFLQLLLKNFTIVPLLTGQTTSANIAQTIKQLWGGKETLIIISSDLSHYHDYKTAQQLDKKAAQAIVNLKPNELDDEQACGNLPINGLLEVAIEKKLTTKLIDLRNSGDTTSNKDQVVGYGAFHFYE